MVSIIFSKIYHVYELSSSLLKDSTNSSHSFCFLLWQYEGNAESIFTEKPTSDPISLYLDIKRELNTKYSVFYQIIRKPLVISLNQIRMILHRLDYAFENGLNISNQPEMELLLYLSLQRQISEALIFAGGLSKKIQATSAFSCDHILFGEKNKISNAIQWLSQKIPKKGYSSWQSPNQSEIKMLIQRYNFSYSDLLRRIPSQNKNSSPNSEDPEINSKIKELDVNSAEIYFNQIYLPEMVQAMEDVFNFYSLKLFNESIRPTKLYSIKNME